MMSQGSTCRRPLRSLRMLIMAAGAAVWLVPSAVSAQGWIEPRAGVRTGEWGVEKLRTTVSVRVTGRVAEVEVEEWFRNNGGDMGEGDYVYPLPGEAVFSNYSLYQGDQELRGEMMDAARAREIYEAIVRARQDPALIELVGKGMLRARVFPIEAGQTRKVTLRYTQVLGRAGDALQFRYAAGARHVGRGFNFTPVPLPQPLPDRPVPRPPRPQPRPGMPQPMDERVPVRSIAEPVPLTFTMVVDDAGQFRDAFSPTHPVRVERERGRMTVRPRAELQGDFAVFLPFAASAVGLTLATHRDPGDDGYFMLTLSPGAVAAARVPRDMTVVVDVSGSMSGEKMEQTRRALHQLLGTLGSEDRIRLIAFSSGVRSWRDDWTPASRADLGEARRWVDALRADGGTNIHAALEAAFRAETPAARLPIVIFMTDGMPTNGETRPDRIVAMAEAQRGRARVFAFGVGYDVNTQLLDQLTEAARGTTQYVRPNEDVEEAVSILAAKVRHPVLTDLVLERGPVTITEVYPRDLPDLFAGEELVLFGRYTGTGNGSLAVTGRRNNRSERYATEARFPARAGGSDYIARLWAARKLGDLDRRIRSARADGAGQRQVQELIAELRETALRYGLLSDYTAYLVQEPGVLAVNNQGVRNMTAAAPASASGQAAVARAEEARRARSVVSVQEMDAVQKLSTERLALESLVVTGARDAAVAGARHRIVAGRTFQLEGSVWQDTGHTKDHRVVEVAAYSDAYFALIRALPELGLVLKELDTALVAGRKVSVRVGTAGTRTMSESDVSRFVAEFRGIGR